MENIWEILGIEQTVDRDVIKRAYAVRTGEWNPEDYPEECLRLRNACERALAYAAEETGPADKGGAPDFGDRAFVCYFLRTAFHGARGIREGVILAEYLKERMSCPEDCSRRSTAQGAGGPEGYGGAREADSTKGYGGTQAALRGSSLEMRFGEQGENILSIRFHSGYVEYIWNGRPLVPRFPGQELEELEDAQFWLLAPIAAAPFEALERIYGELVERLNRLPMREEDIPVIADCIAGSICHSAQEEAPLCSFYAQKEEQLYGCDVFAEGALTLYQEETGRKMPLPGGQYQVQDVETAVKMGKRLLWELTMEWEVEVWLERLPGRILVQNRWNMSSVLTGEEVTQEAVQELLRSYFADNIIRLELDFGGRALVFIKDRMGQYGCFYFEHDKHRWFALVGMPEVYETVDEKDVVTVPFGLGMLPDYLVHLSLGYMKCQLEKVLGQTACEKPDPAFLMWSCHVYFTAEEKQYRLAQRLFGAFPPEQACSRMQEAFYIPELPALLSYVDAAEKASGTLEVSRDKEAVQTQLSRYMAGGLKRLVLKWQLPAGAARSTAADLTPDPPAGREGILNRWILLWQEQGCHQMIYLDDARRGMEYLVHTDLRRIRDCLDLLIPQIVYPDAILGQSGEFAFSDGEDFEKVREYLASV